MHRHYFVEAIIRKERELQIEIDALRAAFPHRPHWKDELLFEFHINNTKILQPMDVSKVIGPFAGTLVFKDAEGEAISISNVKSLTLGADNAAVGNVALSQDAGGIVTGAFAGAGIAAGKLTLTATCVNDAGATITGVSSITFHADTTVTEVDVNIN